MNDERYAAAHALGPETAAKAKAAAEIIRGLQHGRPDHTMIGLRGKGAEAIAFMRADELLTILDAAAAHARPDGAPEGYCLVPIAPTDEMHDAARDWSQKEYGKPIGIEASSGCWGAMLSAAPAPQGDGWREIDSAPKDGSSILVWLPKPRFGSNVQHMRTGNVAIIGGGFAFDCPKPTHWMPLPAPPSDRAPQGGKNAE